MVELTGEGRACIPVDLTKTWDGLVNWRKCVWKVEETHFVQLTKHNIAMSSELCAIDPNDLIIY